jgi:TP901 family phage tail tape measure protein
MPNFVVSTTFDGKNKLSPTFKEMWKDAGKFGKNTDLAFQRAGRGASKFGNIVKGILAASAIQKGTSLITEGMMGVTSSFVAFDDAATAASVRFKDIGPDAKDFNTQMQAIKDSARAAGAATEFTATQSAEALDFLARAGFSSVEAMGSLNSMINLATATGEDFASVADMSSDLLGAFGLSSDNAAQKIKNLSRLNDVLVKTTNSANVTVENMFETMKTVGPISGILGASLEEVAALTAVMGNSGIKGSDAMTALKNAYLRLAAPVGAGADILASLNLTLDDGTGNAKKMTTLMEELGGKLKGLGNVKQAEILDAIFGKRAIAGGKNIIDNIANVKKYEKALLNAGETSQKSADIMRQSLGNRLKTLGSAATEMGFKFLDAFQVRGKKGIDAITEAIRNFDVKPVIAGIERVIVISTGLISAVRPFIPLLTVLAGGMLAYNIALKAQIALGAIKHFFAFIKVIQAAAGAQGILNVVMSANPIGAVIAGITLLIAAGVLLYQNWDKVKVVFISAFGGIKTYFLKFASFLVNTWSAIIKGILGAISKVGGAFGFDTEGIDGIISKIEGLQGKLNANIQAGIPEQTAPNAKEAEARRNNVGFVGTLDITGAPEGSKATGKTTGAPQINMNMLGSNL